MSDLDIARLDASTHASYAAFVDAHPHAMLYHSLPYLRLLERITGAENVTQIAVTEKGTIAAVLPVFGAHGPLGTVYNSLPFYGSHGGILSSDDTATAALTKAWNTLARAPDTASATLIEPLLHPTDTHTIAHNCIDTRIGQFTPIAHAVGHAEALMESFHSKTRNMVRKSQKQGFTVAVENDALAFLQSTHRDNLAQLGGRAKSSEFFAAFPEIFTADTHYRIWVAHYEGAPVAALLLFYHRDMVEYFMPVVAAEWREKQPLSLLIYEAMCDASRRGYRLWNWGGTWLSQEGVYLFKKRWGAEETRYRYYTHIKRDDIYAQTPASLSATYPDFFVVPFDRLTARAS